MDMMKKGTTKKNINDLEEDSDRISLLPESIIHHILSYLGAKEVARTCVLSKAWRCMVSTFPVIEFLFTFRWSRLSSAEGKLANEGFMKFVDDSIGNRIVHSFNLLKFRLDMCYVYTEMLAGRLDHWLNVVLKHKSLKELDLSLLSYTRPCCYYSVPRTIFLAESLSVLRLRFNFQIEVNNLAGMKLGRLRELCLSGIVMDNAGKILESFFSGCPLMEYFELRECFVGSLLSLCIPSTLLRLHKVVLNSYALNVEVQAPNLHAFEFGERRSFHDEIKLVMTACKALKELSLGNTTIKDEQFQDLISSKPGIEVLNLVGINGLTTIDLSNYKLKRLVLINCNDLLIVTVKTLVSLTLEYPYKFRMPLKFASTLFLQEIHLKFFYGPYYGTQCFVELRKLLAKVTQNIQLRVLVSYCKSLLIHESPHELLIPPPHFLEELLIPPPHFSFEESTCRIVISSKKIVELLTYKYESERPHALSMISAGSCTQNLHLLSEALLSWRNTAYNVKGVEGPKDKLASLWETFVKSCSTLQYQISTLKLIWTYKDVPF